MYRIIGTTVIMLLLIVQSMYSQTWKRMDSPPLPPTGIEYTAVPRVAKMAFFDTLNGIAISSTQHIRTTDGGLHWSRIDTTILPHDEKPTYDYFEPETRFDIAVSGEGYGYYTKNEKSLRPIGSSRPVVFYYITKNKGETWSKDSIFGADIGFGISRPLVSCSDSVIALGSYCRIYQNGGLLLHSTITYRSLYDSTWTTLGRNDVYSVEKMLLTIGINRGSYCGLGSGRRVMPGETGPDMTIDTSTRNIGAQFRFCRAVNEGSAKLKTASHTRLGKVIAVCSTSAGRHGIYMSSDSGYTFSRMADGYFGALHFDKSGLHGVATYDPERQDSALSRQYIARTTDGGYTWWAQKLENVKGGMYGVYVMDSNRIYLCGEYGQIVRSDNGGGALLPLSSVSSVPSEGEAIGEGVFQIYPNPAQESLEVRGSENGSIELIDLMGRVVLTSDESRVDISGVQSGVYVISSGKHRRVVIINH